MLFLLQINFLPCFIQNLNIGFLKTKDFKSIVISKLSK